ncbi:MAG: TIGR03751 family conjugal transfer lipoprotein [Proteobacteria bacterium]|nr:TIGR03751 family conjugal transfer lipoprotein [Pseudomonadota bacterium]
MTMRHQTLTLIVLISLAACAGNKDTILPIGGPSMKSIYTEHFNDIGMRDPTSVRKELKARPLNADAIDLAGYTRDAFNELDSHFPRLPNPTLVMYVFPHLAGVERVPVPGYATTFPMYRQVEYALPGEVPATATQAAD